MPTRMESYLDKEAECPIPKIKVGIIIVGIAKEGVLASTFIAL